MQKDIIYLKKQYFGQVNKLKYANKSKENILEKNRVVAIEKKEQKVNTNISEEIIKRENTIIAILINNPENYQIIKEHMRVEDFKYEINNKIITYLYEELEKQDSNISSILDKVEDEQIQSHLTAIMAEDYGITDNRKAIEDILKKYEIEKLKKRREELIKETSLEQDSEKRRKIGEELIDINLRLKKIK